MKTFTCIRPRVYKPFETKTSIALLFTRLPIDWVEKSAEVPILQACNVVGLPLGFSIESNLQTIVVSNQLRIGPRWNCENLSDGKKVIN